MAKKNRPAKRNAKLPHYRVYTRLRCSKLHGVGVFAVINIPKGMSTFYGDDDELVWVHKNKLKGLPKEVRRLYEDFGIIKGHLYGCPRNFNQLTLAWYMNESKNPNVGCGEDYRFFALRNIKAGEELTVSYATYSDPSTMA